MKIVVVIVVFFGIYHPIHVYESTGTFNYCQLYMGIRSEDEGGELA